MNLTCQSVQRKENPAASLLLTKHVAESAWFVKSGVSEEVLSQIVAGLSPRRFWQFSRGFRLASIHRAIRKRFDHIKRFCPRECPILRARFTGVNRLHQIVQGPGPKVGLIPGWGKRVSLVLVPKPRILLLKAFPVSEYARASCLQLTTRLRGSPISMQAGNG